MASNARRTEILGWLKEEDGRRLRALFAAADRMRREAVGDEVHLRGLIEFSSYCLRSCLYCGLRNGNTALVRYRLTEHEIIGCCREALRLKIPTVVLQSGEEGKSRVAWLCRVVRRVKRLGLAVTLGAGELPEDEYRRLKDAGADRYLLKFETSDPRLYSRLRPGCRLTSRLNCLRTLKKLGYQVGSGIMVGLPGQSLASIADDILLFKELDLDMVGIGPFIPHPQTPLAGPPPAGIGLALKTVALTRLVLPLSHIPATTASATLDASGREKALCRGANVVMPNITPVKYRELYQIYPGKACLRETADVCVPCLSRRVHSLGRTIASGRGDALRPSVR